MKILFVMNSLTGGGAERVFVDLVKNMDQNKHDVTVLVVDDYGIYKKEVREMTNYKYVLRHEEKQGIKRKWFGALSIIGSKIIHFLPAEILYKLFVKDKYDVEIAYIEGESTKIVAGSNNPNSIKYAWLHTDMIKNPWTRKVYKKLENEINDYKKFDHVVAVSEAVKEAFEEKYQLPAKVIYNALDDKSILAKAREDTKIVAKKDMFNIITVGGLKEVKGYMRLLQVMNRMIREGKKVYLTIIGEGDERENLEKYISKNNMEKNVLLYGFTTNPYKILVQGDLYVCSSYAEGFSTAVTESLILGIPVLTTECAGMRELLGDSEYGMIVENSEEGLYEGIKGIIEDPEKLCEMRNKAKERGKAFSVVRRIEEIDKMLVADYQKKRNHEK